MDVRPTSWSSLDWGNIDVFDVRYYQSLYFAILERYFRQDATPRREGDYPLGQAAWEELEALLSTEPRYPSALRPRMWTFSEGGIPSADGCAVLTDALRYVANEKLFRYAYPVPATGRLSSPSCYLPMPEGVVETETIWDNPHYTSFSNAFDTNALFGDSYDGARYPYSGMLLDSDGTRAWLKGMKDAITRLRYAILPCCRLYYHKITPWTFVPNPSTTDHDFSDALGMVGGNLSNVSGYLAPTDIQNSYVAWQSAAYSVGKPTTTTPPHQIYGVRFETKDLRWKNFSGGTVEVYGVVHMLGNPSIGGTTLRSATFFDFGTGFSENTVRHLATVPPGGTFEGVFSNDTYAIPPIGVKPTTPGEYQYHMAVALVGDFNSAFSFKA